MWWRSFYDSTHLKSVCLSTGTGIITRCCNTEQIQWANKNVGFWYTASMLFAFIMYSFVIPHIILKAKDYGLFCCCCCCYCCLPLCIWSAGLNSHAKAQQSHLPLWSSSNKTSLIGNLLLYYFSIHPSVSECFFNIFHDVFVQIHQFFLQDAVTKSVFLFYLFLFLSYHHFWPFLSFRAEKENNVVNTNLSTVYLVL